MNTERTKLKAFSLLEILLVLAIFTIVVSAIGGLSINTLYFADNQSEKLHALVEMQETISAIQINKNDLWKAIIDHTNSGPKHISFVNNEYQISNGPLVEDGVTVSFVITNAYRDGSGNLVESGGTEDLSTRAVDINTQWTNKFGNTRELNQRIYITNWDTKQWVSSTQSDFNPGILNGSLVTETGDGSVELDLDSTVNADWCLPELTISEADLPGNGIAHDVTAIPGNAFMGTGGNSSGISFANIFISDDQPPTIQVEGTYDGFKTNAIFGEDNYAYLATDDNLEKVVILDISNYPYQMVGYGTGPGSADVDTVYVQGNRGYFTQASRLIVFDLSSKTGERPVLGSIYLANTATDLIVSGNYAYVLNIGSSNALQIINISNPANMSVVGTASLPWSTRPTALAINSNSTRAYIGVIVSLFPEIYTIDISTKTGSRPTISTFDTGLMSVIDLALVEEHSRLLAGGILGQEYQVLDITNETNIVKCGGLNINEGVSGIAAVKFPDSGNTFSYIITGVFTAEFKVIQGGAAGGGGGNGQGSEYLTYGEYESPIFDSGASTSTYYTIEWDEQIFVNTDIQLQIRTGNQSNLSDGQWMGPDGTNATYFEVGDPTYLPAALSNKRYFQYKVILTSDKVNTPIFEYIRLNYE